MARKLSIIGISAVLTLVLVVSMASSSSYIPGGIILGCNGWTGDDRVAWTFDRHNIDDATNAENFYQVWQDGAGNLLQPIVIEQVTHGSWGVGYGEPWDDAPQYNPLTMHLYSMAGNGLEEVLVGTETGTCEGLPTYVGPTPTPPAPSPAAIACPVLPANAVVGNLPFSTPAFYAPGKLAIGVTVNAGTYWVLGVDETSEYYKIQIGCERLWLPVSVLQPSYEAPWSGQSLPINVVS